MSKTTDVTLTHATIDGRQIDWDTLIRAAVQDRQSTGADWRGMPLAPNAEHDLADAYRRILRDLLPEVSAAKDAAYLEYTRSQVTTRDPASAVHAAGHGSWVSGPDGAKQQAWYDWRSLEERVAKAAT